MALSRSRCGNLRSLTSSPAAVSGGVGVVEDAIVRILLGGVALCDEVEACLRPVPLAQLVSERLAQPHDLRRGLGAELDLDRARPLGGGEHPAHAVEHLEVET